jgi:hypothetical protein
MGRLEIRRITNNFCHQVYSAANSTLEIYKLLQTGDGIRAYQLWDGGNTLSNTVLVRKSGNVAISDVSAGAVSAFRKVEDRTAPNGQCDMGRRHMDTPPPLETLRNRDTMQPHPLALSRPLRLSRCRLSHRFHDALLG